MSFAKALAVGGGGGDNRMIVTTSAVMLSRAVWLGCGLQTGPQNLVDPHLFLHGPERWQLDRQIERWQVELQF